MSDRPLVYYAARCSGGTAIHAILRDLLVLHGVLVSYADLLWRPNRTLARLKAFVPCGALRGITTDFEPVLGRDVFPGNHWKVQGTVLGFARAHPPRSLGYVNGRCANGTESAVEAYLREFS